MAIVFVFVTGIDAVAKTIGVELVGFFVGLIILFVLTLKGVVLLVGAVFLERVELLLVDRYGVDIPILFHVPAFAQFEPLRIIVNVFGLLVLGIVACVPLAIAVGVGN